MANFGAKFNNFSQHPLCNMFLIITAVKLVCSVSHYTCTSINYFITLFNAELAKLTVWLSANKLTFNTSKSHFMIFHRAKLKSSDTNMPVILVMPF